MPKKITNTQLNYRANLFTGCINTSQVEQLLKLKNYSFIQNILQPEYYYFKISKPKGGYREIEAPSPNLKIIQRKLNEYLQCVYHTKQSISAYGFVLNTIKQARNNTTKNIVSNAKQHLGKNYLLNIDFNDFFHQISKKEVFNIFINNPFSFSKTLANTLAKICTNKGRLPMGAPTSPVLSNFACLGLDKELETWATNKQISYTRFVDDLSFSSNNKITQNHFNEIKQITDKYEFEIDNAKTKWYSPQQDKIVTGLLLKDKVELQNNYLKELDKDLDRLQKTIEVQIITGNLEKPIASKKFKQEVMGKINFIAVVKGYESQQYEKYILKYETAINPPNKDLLSLRWINFNNYKF